MSTPIKAARRDGRAGTRAAPKPGPLARLQHRLARWLFRLHGAEAGEVLLRQRRVFIVPTRAGLSCALMVALMFVGALNYNLSLGYALTFLLAGCALVDIHLTFRNLAYLSLSAAQPAPVFAGQEAQFDLHLINRTRLGRFAIHVGFHEAGATRRYPQQALDLPALATRTVSLYIAAPQRGWLAAPRVRLQTHFPLGLLRAWAYWAPAAPVLVYPQPEPQAPPLPLAAGNAPGQRGATGSDDFGGIRPYQSGDALRQLAWRQIARLDLRDGGQLLTKQFDGGDAGRLALDFAALPAELGLEHKLARMTRWVLEAEQRALPYSFALDATVYGAACGPAQQARCLRALALYGLAADAPS